MLLTRFLTRCCAKNATRFFGAKSAKANGKAPSLPLRRVAVTGAAGQVAYSILFRIAS